MKILQNSIITIIALTFIFITNCFAQSKFSLAISPDSLVGNVYGTVVDSSTGKPIVNSEVYLFTQSFQKGNSGNIISTNNGEYILPALNTAIKQSITDANGRFLINNVQTPAPYRYYTILIKSAGYNQLIINQVPVLPGAVMALQVNAKLSKNSSLALYYDGKKFNGPFLYRDQAMAKSSLMKISNKNNNQLPQDLNYLIYATREGLVGETTANGHVIVANDHFVALPSFNVLNKKDQYDFEVKVSYGNKSVVAPVWDVGPWNVKDDYWNPDSLRQIYATLHHGGKPGLGQGVPEAMAAYYYNYNQDWSGDFNNSGSDYYMVKLPAAIDLADGTFLNDLKLPDNTWVKVDYLWRPGVTIGDTVKATDTIPVANSPGGTSIGQELKDSVGVIIGGPGAGNYSGTYYIWWKIKWKDGQEGWSFEKYLQKINLGDINITIQTVPTGLGFSVDGKSHYAPYTFTSKPDSVHSIYTITQNSGSDTRNVFLYWNDKRLNPHNIYPYTNSTYTAYFTTQYLVKVNFNPTDGGSTSLGNTSVYLNKDSIVNINAVPNPGFVFNNWSGDVTGSQNPLTISINNPISITANFSLLPDNVQGKSSNLPDKYSIDQNYPNPFNPNTIIKYALPEISNVQISVFNILGQKVKELVNETEGDGYYKINFNANGLSSGLYFYKISAHSLTSKKQFDAVRKLILLK